MYLPQKFRDVTLIRLNQDEALVIACDSSGGIGPKEKDVVKVPGKVLGRLICRVALMELLATGAMPVAVVNTLSVEMEPSGREILEGIREEVRLAGLDPESAVTGSTEENVPVCQSGMGITAIGIVNLKSFSGRKAKEGDRIVCCGIPKVGEEVVKGGVDDPDVADLPLVLSLREKPYVHDLLPVGSKGILYEAKELCRSAGKTLYLYPDIRLDLLKSAGPATCVLAAVPAEDAVKLGEEFTLPLTVIGEVRE